jgi:hypothetical protein
MDDAENNNEFEGTAIQNGPWETPVIRSDDGHILGITLTLMPKDLDELGIASTSNEFVYYYISEDSVQVTDRQMEPDRRTI